MITRRFQNDSSTVKGSTVVQHTDSQHMIFCTHATIKGATWIFLIQQRYTELALAL